MKNKIVQRILQKRMITAAEIGSRADLKKAAEHGVDFAVLYHTTILGIPKIGGILPFGNANEIVLQMIETIKPKESPVPIIAGLCGTEPFRIRDRLVLQLKEKGVACVQNFPSVGIVDGNYRENLTAINQGYEKECVLIRKSLENGLLCFPLVFNASEALMMAKAGAEILVVHAGAMAIATEFCMTEGKFEKYWEKLEIIGDVIKNQYPNVMILAYTENHKNVDKIINRVCRSNSQIDGVYHSISLI